MAPSLSRAQEWFAETVADGIYATGGQLYVEHAGAVLLDVAEGSCVGSPIQTDSVHAVYCATKPVLSLVLAHLVEAGDLSYGVDVQEFCHELDWTLPGTTLSTVLSHSASLAQPSAIQWRMTPPSRRKALLCADQSDPYAYSEIAGWAVIASAIERATGVSAAEATRRLVLEPLGLRGICLDQAAASDAVTAGTVRVPLDGLPDGPLPMLSEQLPAQVVDSDVAFGGLASMSDLGRLYSSVRLGLQGSPEPGIPSQVALQTLLDCRRPAVWDATLGRTCAFAGGFMVDMTTHRVGTLLNADSIGHSAGVANAVGLCDVDADLSIAMYFNGVAVGAEDVEFLRSRMLDLVVRELL